MMMVLLTTNNKTTKQRQQPIVSIFYSSISYLLYIISRWQQIRWTIPLLLRDAIRLCLFVLCLSPGFARFCFYYTFPSRRTVRAYAHDSWRQSLDIYKPHSQQQQDERAPLLQPQSSSPVVVFYTGGAWCIGYKMWGALLARALTAAGILVVIPDYRNFPSVCIPDMVKDVESSLLWVRDHIEHYGGDPNKIVIVGQSAGGHLACTLLLKRAMEQAALEEQEGGENRGDEPQKASPPPSSLKPTDFKGFISLSAPYDLNAMQSSIRRHGLHDEIVDRVFDGQVNAYTPSRMAEACRQEGFDLSEILPPTLLLHGTKDVTVPHHGSALFYRQLQAIMRNASALNFTTYQGWSHTDAILEMPMNANHRFHKDVFRAVQQWTSSTDLEWPDQDAVITKRLCPACLVSLGQSVNPF
jgi:prenylcysteine alpha-carboxyl methylesterase